MAAFPYLSKPYRCHAWEADCLIKLATSTYWHLLIGWWSHKCNIGQKAMITFHKMTEKHRHAVSSCSGTWARLCSKLLVVCSQKSINGHSCMPGSTSDASLQIRVIVKSIVGIGTNGLSQSLHVGATSKLAFLLLIVGLYNTWLIALLCPVIPVLLNRKLQHSGNWFDNDNILLIRCECLLGWCHHTILSFRL